MKKLVIGVGNPMRGDDALGVEVIRKLRENPIPDIDYITAQGDLSTLIELWINKEVIIIDCVQSGQTPGSIHYINSFQKLTGSKEVLSTTHGMNLSETISLAQELGKLPSDLKFYGIEGKEFGLGKTLSREVMNSLSTLVEMILSRISNNGNSHPK